MNNESLPLACQCPVAGWCSRFRREMLGRYWELCSGHCVTHPCTVNQRVQYLSKWYAEAGIIVDPKALLNQIQKEADLQTSSPIQLAQPTPASFSQRVTNFALAMTTETAWRAKGGAAPTEEEKAQRRACCDPCEHRDASNDSCRLCGCYLESGLLPPRPLGKLDCATQQCPAGKWTYTGGYTPPQGAGCGSCGKKA